MELPHDVRIHPIFHVSQLEKKLGTGVIIQENIPSHIKELVREPERILERRIDSINNKLAFHILVKWKELPEIEATWEEYCDVIKKLPTLDLGQGPFFKGMRVIMAKIWHSH